MNLNCNILHLEDDDNDSLFFQRVLTRLQFMGAYRRVSTVEQTIDYLNGNREFADRKLFPLPGVLVCDSLVSGEKTMADLMMWLDEQPALRFLPRIILTGGMSPLAQQDLINRGVTGIVTKGASLTEFAVAVEEVLRRYTI